MMVETSDPAFNRQGSSVSNPIASLLQGVPLGADNRPGFGWDDIDVWRMTGIILTPDPTAQKPQPPLNPAQISHIPPLVPARRECGAGKKDGP